MILQGPYAGSSPEPIKMVKKAVILQYLGGSGHYVTLRHS